MIIVIIVAALVIAGVILLNTVFHSEIGTAMLVVGVPAAIICGLIVLISNVNPANRAEAKQNERDIIVYQLEKNTYENDPVNTAILYEDIADFNSDLIKFKGLYDSPWFGWFTPQWMKDIDPIDYQSYE